MKIKEGIRDRPSKDIKDEGTKTASRLK